MRRVSQEERQRSSEHGIGRSHRAVLEALYEEGPLTFTQLRDLLEMSDGNVSQIARRLQRVGHIEVTRVLAGFFTRTTYTLTERGRTALAEAK